MKKQQTIRKTLPHFGVFTRLGRSKIHGLGVFAIKKIKKGTYIFHPDNDEIVWVKKGGLRGLPKGVKRLYQDFSIIKDRGRLYGCPKNFNRMTISWYLNESKYPNVGCDLDYRFFALRDIREGEELTVDYKTYNEFG